MNTHSIIQIANVAYIVDSSTVAPSDHVLYAGDALSCEYAFSSIEYDLEHFGRVLGMPEFVSG